MHFGVAGLESGAWTWLGTTVVSSFLASLVECVEALTVVLAVGCVRGWRSVLAGAAAALALLTAIVGVLGPALARIPLHRLVLVPFHMVQLVVGALILLFGLRWLRKAILRSAGLVPLHDERAAFAKKAAAMREANAGSIARWDKFAFSAAFNITMLEGTEVVFIVLAFGAGGAGAVPARRPGRSGGTAGRGGTGSRAAPSAGARSGKHTEVPARRAALRRRNVLGG